MRALEGFTSKYQETRDKSWDELSDEMVDYIWLNNQPGDGDLAFGYLFAGALGLLDIIYPIFGYRWIGVVILVGLIGLHYAVSYSEQRKMKKLSREEKIRQVEILQDVRREPLP